MPQRFRIYEGIYPHFITSTVVHWIPVFCRDDYFRVLADSLNYCIEQRGLHVHAYVIMPNHFHMICSQDAGDISGVVRDIKRFTSHSLTQMLERDGRTIWLRAMKNAAESTFQAKLWDEAFHPEQLHSRAFYDQKLNYIHNNPVRAGYVDNPLAWRYSSAGYYLEDAESLIRTEPVEW